MDVRLVTPQVMVTKEVAEANDMTLKDLMPTGTCVLVEGILSKTPEGVKQAVELKVLSVSGD
jgi:asparaginyl-tRNA synthetase